LDIHIQQLIAQATEHHKANDLEEAASIYRQILLENADHVEVLHSLGLLYVQQNKLDLAIEIFNKAIKISPKNEIFYNNLGEIYRRKGDLQKSLDTHLKSVKVKTGYANGYLHIGHIHKAMGKYFDAIDAYEKAGSLNSNLDEAYYHLGFTNQEMGRLEIALGHYEKCLQINDKNEWAFYQLGLIYLHNKVYGKAEPMFLKAIEANNRFDLPLTQLAKLFENQGEHSKAYSTYKKLLEIRPNDPLVSLSMETIHPQVFEDVGAVDDFLKQLDKVIDTYEEIPIDPTNVHLSAFKPFKELAYFKESTISIKKKIARLLEKAMPKIEAIEVGEKPHIGFVVLEGEEEGFINALAGLVNQLNNEKFRITIVCSLPFGYNLLEPIMTNMSIGFLSIPQRFDLAAQQMLNAQFDWLYYWQSGTGTFSSLLPQVRLAKVQCTSLGWAEPSGISNIDYNLSNIPSEQDEKTHSNRLSQFDLFPFWIKKPPHWKNDASEYSLTADRNHYLCPFDLRLIHPEFDDVLKQILSRDKKGTVLFFKDEHENITTKLTTRLNKTLGHLSNNIIFLADRGNRNSIMQNVKVILDPLYHGGDVGSYFYAAYCGTPVITLPQKRTSSKLASSLYRQIDINDCIANDLTDYIEKSVHFANDDVAREKISKSISKLSESLFENDEVVVAFENFIEKSLGRK